MKSEIKEQRGGDFYSIRAVDRAIQVLNCFSSQKREHPLGELAQLTKLPKSSVSRIIQTLEKQKFITFDPFIRLTKSVT